MKKTLIQIGKKFYSLKFEFEVSSFEELQKIIENKKYDLKLLKSDEE